MRSVWSAAVVMLAAVASRPVSAATPAETSAAEIAGLVAALGAEDYAVRETAAAQLAALGPLSADALLTAAETSADVEVALRASWLADSIPPTSPRDPPEVTAELQRYQRADAAARLQIIRRLVRLDDDAGIEAVARLVRLERSAETARMAAALLVREWQPGDPFWQRLRPRIAAGLQESGRPAARFLRAVVAGSGGDPAEAARAADEAAAALALLQQAIGRQESDAAAHDDDAAVSIFRRGLVDLLLAAHRRPAALEAIRPLFAKNADKHAAGQADDDADQTAATLIWAVEHGLPEAVGLLEPRWPGLEIDDPVTAYAAAVALAAGGDRPRAERVAEEAFKAGQSGGFTDRLRAGLLLAKWGAADWALREYRALLDDPQTPAGEFALAGILCSEFLHDIGRDDDAAAALRQVVGGRHEGAAEAEETLRRLERDPEALRARAAFFASCAAAARGDAAGRRRLIDDAVRHHGRDVDALIALYEISAADPQERAAARTRVERTLERIDDEIAALPDEANGYNEYAWLVANTEGDVKKAIRYSKKSLEMAFDNSSYLDTLAHCRFAAGDAAAAVRIQSLARRLEPHSRTIERNLERFRAAAASPAP